MVKIFINFAFIMFNGKLWGIFYDYLWNNDHMIQIICWIHILWIDNGHVQCSTEIFQYQQGKSEGFDSSDLLSNLKLDSNLQFVTPCDHENWWMTSKNNRVLLTTSHFVHHFKFICEFKLELQSGNTQFWSKLAIFCPVWPWNLIDDLGKQ